MDVAQRQRFLASTSRGGLGGLKLQLTGFAKVLPGEDGGEIPFHGEMLVPGEFLSPGGPRCLSANGV